MPARRVAVALALTVAVTVGFATFGAAQIDCVLNPDNPNCATTTTTPPDPTSSSTTEVDETTTTTTEEEPTSTTEELVDDEETPIPEETTTTSTPALLEEGPPSTAGAPGAPGSVTTTTAPPADGDGSDTGRQVGLIVTALVVLAVIFGLITYWYWRRTRPLVQPAT